MPVGIITGTAIYTIPSIAMEEISVDTPYGEALILRGMGENSDLIFLPRHGPKHSTPPHKVNYRANIRALSDLGVTHVLAAYAVGSINTNMPPMSLVAIDDFIDFTSGREATFFDGGVTTVRHIDVSEPFCSSLRGTLLALSAEYDLEIIPAGTYVCTNGPRLESPAEVRMLGKLGGDVIGMTAIPEITLAKELDICFAAVAFSVNWAAGIEKKINFVEDGLGDLSNNLLDLFIGVLREASG
ncbi:MAG: MTAP family purine nucleoside phosphorylase [Anaerolineales bacterium]|nr:MTAP family purine nucleoside phosphorylase [Anaerolineales bacterium]